MSHNGWSLQGCNGLDPWSGSAAPAATVSQVTSSPCSPQSPPARRAQGPLHSPDPSTRPPHGLSGSFRCLEFGLAAGERGPREAAGIFALRRAASEDLQLPECWERAKRFGAGRLPSVAPGPHPSWLPASPLAGLGWPPVGGFVASFKPFHRFCSFRFHSLRCFVQGLLRKRQRANLVCSSVKLIQTVSLFPGDAGAQCL